jgi:NAD(P)-dependent dehydrogenase (short-subunit alcohol dehydrogenase family)
VTKQNTLFGLAGGLTAALLAKEIWMRRREANLEGQIALVTGGSRGLGLLLAREFAHEGCRVAICARDQAELDHAQAALRDEGIDVLTVVCDVGDRAQVERMVEQVHTELGLIDILVNNAGTIQVGPVESFNLDDFQRAHDTIYWGTLHTILAVVPQMRARHRGRIVNIASIGGKVSAPHLLPYGGAKFALVGLSQGLRAELAADGITVTTIVPGLMRTGSHLNALFKGDQPAEYGWFSVGASLPLVSMDAERAARQIVRATKRGEAERVLTLPAVALAKFSGLFPGTTANILGLVNRLLPDAPSTPTSTVRGMAVEDEVEMPLHDQMTTLGDNAAEELNQRPGPRPKPTSTRSDREVVIAGSE